MLEYEKQIFLDILHEDGLVIAARGLGLESVLLSLLKVNCDPGNLIFVLGSDGKQQEWLVNSLKSSGVVPPPRVISADISANERQLSYLEGGVWFVPNRILVVDLLKKRIPVELITGIFVWKAHNMLKNHQEAFIIRLYRQGNKTGFVKAFSNYAPGFKGGFSKVEQVMKLLFVRKLFLWPRYHASVKNTLAAYSPKVIEMHLEMSSQMLQLQTAILDLTKISIQELNRLNPLLDTDEINVENAIDESFYKLLHSQLDPVWHALSERTKFLLTDLKLFHYLIRALIVHDSISFYKLISSQRSSESVLKGSGWHLLPSAEILFTVSAQRVFSGATLVENEKNFNPEPNPKWVVLSEVLSEIYKRKDESESVHDEETGNNEEEDIEKQLTEMFEGKDDNNSAKILVLCREERTCAQLNLYLTQGAEELLRIQYRKCFPKKSDTLKKDNSENSTEEEKEKKNEANEESEDIQDTYILSLTQTAFTQLDSDEKRRLAGCFEESTILDDAKPSDKESEIPYIVIKSYKEEQMTLPATLKQLKPKWVVLYDCDVTVIRQLEVHQRCHPHTQITVYFLIFGGTVEEQAYLTALRKEKEAFELLIEEKARIVLPEDRSDSWELARNVGQVVSQTVDSRTGGLVAEKNSSRLVIVDMREFRSELPSLIHSRGIDIEPLTITVGDYILSPDICVERKSISDLISSLNSGRLYNQAQALTRFYSRPMLLIEFDKDKPFDLQDRYYLSTDTNSEQVVTKLQLLTMHFPQLRLVWSPSPQATAALFDELKEGRPEPEISTALLIGKEDEEFSDERFNPSVQAFVEKLPGISSKNIHKLMMRGGSLDNLRKMSVDEINQILENSEDARLLFDAIHSVPECGEKGSDDGASVAGIKKFGSSRGKRKRFH